MNIKIVAAGVCGFIFGGAIGAFLMKEKYRKESEIAISEIREYYRKERDKVNKHIDKDEKVAETGEKQPQTASQNNDIPNVKSNDFVDYRDYSKKKYEDEVKLYGDIPPSEKPEIPYVITEDQYVAENPHYNKEELYFYSMNRVLTDSDDEVVVDPDTLVGPDLYKRFESQGGYDSFIDEIFIRNDNLSSDYHIVHEIGKFVTEFE